MRATGRSTKDSPRPSGSHLWHQLANERTWATAPGPTATRAEGSLIWDEHGRRLIDGNSGLQNVHIGHGRPEMAAAAAAQLRKLDYFPIYNSSHQGAERLADELFALLPRYQRFLLANSGSEGLDLALKLLGEERQLRGDTGRSVVIGRRGSYHGATLAAIAATGIAGLRDPFLPLLIESSHVSDPVAAPGESDSEASARLGAELVQAIERAGPERVLAVVAEPVQLWNVPVPPDGYWREVRRICDVYDVSLVVDEVITGFGRTGRPFGLDHWDVAADVIVLGKGLASGYVPIAAVGVSPALCATFDAEPGHAFHHVSTTAGHPLACALALENLRIIADEDLVGRAERVGGLLRELLEGHFGARSYVTSIHGIGMLNSVRLDTTALGMGEPGSAARTAANAELRTRLLDHGAYLRVDGQIWFIPPLSTPEPLLEELVRSAAEATEGWVATR